MAKTRINTHAKGKKMHVIFFAVATWWRDQSSQQGGLKHQDNDAKCDYWSVETNRNKLEMPGYMSNSSAIQVDGTAGRIRSFMIIPNALSLWAMPNKTLVDRNKSERLLPVSNTLSVVRPATCKTVQVAIALFHNQDERAQISQTSCTFS